LDEIAGNMSNKCTFSKNKVQVSYFVELPKSNFPDYTNSPTFPWLWAFS